MTEEIIIDGVNVAGCFYFIDHTPPKGQGDWCGAIHKGACKVYSKDCEYNKDCYYKQLKRLEQKNEMIINEYNKLQAEIIGDMEFKEIMLTGITPLKVLQNLKQRNRELQAFYDVHESFKTDFDTNRKLLDKYRSALETIQRMILSAWEQGKYLDGGLYNDLTNEFAKINEVLQ